MSDIYIRDWVIFGSGGQPSGDPTSLLFERDTYSISTDNGGKSYKLTPQNMTEESCWKTLGDLSPLSRNAATLPSAGSTDVSEPAWEKLQDAVLNDLLKSHPNYSHLYAQLYFTSPTETVLVDVKICAVRYGHSNHTRLVTLYFPVGRPPQSISRPQSGWAYARPR